MVGRTPRVFQSPGVVCCRVGGVVVLGCVCWGGGWLARMETIFVCFAAGVAVVVFDHVVLLVSVRA